MNSAVAFVHEQLSGNNAFPRFKAGEMLPLTIRSRKEIKSGSRALKAM